MANVRGGDKIKGAFDDIARRLKNASAVRVGFLEESKYPDGTPVAMIAAIQEFGAPSRNIPPRPYFRNMIADKSGEWADAVAKNLKANDYDALRALQLTGEAIAGQLRQSIFDTNTPANAESTIARKGFDKPLVDTGHMLQSVNYEVKE